MARQGPAILDLGLNKGAEPLFGGFPLFELLQQLPEARNAQVDNGVADLILGLEVVVDVAEWDPGLFGDVGDGRVAKAKAISALFGGFEEPRAMVGYLF